MIQNNNISKKDSKQRLTAFVDPVLVKRAKVRGALEGLTISEIVEKALEEYAPKLEKGNGKLINIKFPNYKKISELIPETGLKEDVIFAKRTKALVVPK